jgi:hypothetical protein
MIYIITTLRSAIAFFFKDFSFFLANALLGLNIIVVVWMGIDCMLRQMKMIEWKINIMMMIVMMMMISISKLQ